MITLRHATLDERRSTFEWLCHSDATCMHMGPPDYPEHSIPTWESFLADFADFYYQPDAIGDGSVMIIARGGRDIGCVCYACFHVNPNMAELDIWMREKAFCGRGYGTDALRQLVEYLAITCQIRRFIIRPSEKNTRAISAYRKVGFTIQADKLLTIRQFLKPAYLEEYGDGDYGLSGTAVLTR